MNGLSHKLPSAEDAAVAAVANVWRTVVARS